LRDDRQSTKITSSICHRLFGYPGTAAAAATAVFVLSVLGPGIKFDPLR